VRVRRTGPPGPPAIQAAVRALVKRRRVPTTAAWEFDAAHVESWATRRSDISPFRANSICDRNASMHSRAATWFALATVAAISSASFLRRAAISSLVPRASASAAHTLDVGEDVLSGLHDLHAARSPLADEGFLRASERAISGLDLDEREHATHAGWNADEQIGEAAAKSVHVMDQAVERAVPTLDVAMIRVSNALSGAQR
jgi:hypothetical protein